MNAKVRQQLPKRKRKLRRRIDNRKGVFQSPAIRPSTTKFELSYRMVVVRKDIKVTRGQQHLFDKQKYFFYITNESTEADPAREVIRHGNLRCNQENTISQGNRHDPAWESTCVFEAESSAWTIYLTRFNAT